MLCSSALGVLYAGLMPPDKSMRSGHRGRCFCHRCGQVLCCPHAAPMSNVLILLWEVCCLCACQADAPRCQRVLGPISMFSVARPCGLVVYVNRTTRSIVRCWGVDQWACEPVVRDPGVRGYHFGSLDEGQYVGYPVPSKFCVGIRYYFCSTMYYFVVPNSSK